MDKDEQAAYNLLKSKGYTVLTPMAPERALVLVTTWYDYVCDDDLTEHEDREAFALVTRLLTEEAQKQK